MKCRISLTITLVALLTMAWPAQAGTIGLEGPLNPGTEGWTMLTIDPSSPPAGMAVTLLPHAVPEYHWWNGCSPTAAGMLFAYWDTYLGRGNLYDGDSSAWDKVDMNMTNPAHYDAEHDIVATLGHYQAGQTLGLTYGSWDRNGNGILDDQAQWDCLADFMRTADGGTSRSNMAQGFMDYAAWDNPATAVSEAYDSTAWTVWDESWNEYVSEIDAGYPVHVGITGHSILGLGYATDAQGIPYVVNWTTWGGGWDGVYGLMPFSEVYAYTLLRVNDVPEPGTCVLLLAGLGLLATRLRRRKTTA
jgi:PEP-CTERM motif